MSTEVGMLDEDAFDDVMDADPEGALELLTDMAIATDPQLRMLARSLAGRMFLDAARTGMATSSGASKLVHARADLAEGDLDLDRSIDALVSARVSHRPVDADQLRVTTWRRPTTALCLLIDRSGSMHGAKLATAAISSAAALFAKTTDCSVLAFSDDVIVLREQNSQRPAAEVVDDLLSLRGSGTTDLANALRAARSQLLNSTAARKVALVISDCRVTSGGDAAPAAEDLDELIILAPADDALDAEDLARRTGGRLGTYDEPMETPAVLNELLIST